MVSGPFLLPFHTLPLPDFWSEWWAAFFGLGAAAAGLLAAREPLRLPTLLLLPVVLIATILLQLTLCRIAFPQIALLNALYMLWAGLLMMLARQLALIVGLAGIADMLAAAVTVGALLGTVPAFAQWLGLTLGVLWVFPNPSGSISGNLGQPNHLAHYLWLGIASALYLHVRGRMPRYVLWLCILPLAFGSLLSGSRSVFAYPLILFLALICARFRGKRGLAGRGLLDAALLLPLLVALSLLTVSIADPMRAAIAPLVAKSPATQTPATALKRLSDAGSDTNTRLALARPAWDAFLDRPWLGQGSGNYPWASFAAAARSVSGEHYLPAEHAHNLVLQLLAEFGAPATAIVVLLLFAWGWRFLRQEWGPEHVWCASVLGIGGLHAMLEYPHWFSYFLGPAALLLGATDAGRTVLPDSRRWAAYLALAIVGGTWSLVTLRIDYTAIEAAANRPLAGNLDKEIAWRRSLDTMIRLQHESLLSPWAMLALATRAEASREQAQDRARLCRQGIRFSPERSLVTRCAMQLALAGAEAEARELVGQVLRAYPTERAATLEQLREGADTFPEVKTLLAVALDSSDASR
jgi:O-antigen ligase